MCAEISAHEQQDHLVFMSTCKTIGVCVTIKASELDRQVTLMCHMMI